MNQAKARLMQKGVKVIEIETVDSTNNYACVMAQQGQGEIAIVKAQAQTQGRGRFQRPWVSPKNKGIYASFIFTPNKPLEDLSQLGILCAVAVVRVLNQICSIRIKWPNDIMGEKGKLGGILIEPDHASQMPSYVIAGIGINVNSVESELPQGASSLFLETGTVFSINNIFFAVSNEIVTLYNNFKSDTGFLLPELEQYCDIIGKRVVARQERSAWQGQVEGFDSRGFLMVRDTNGKLRRVSSWEENSIRIT